MIFWRVSIVFVSDGGSSILRLRTCFISVDLVNTRKKKRPKKRHYTEKVLERKRKKAQKALKKKRKNALKKKATDNETGGTKKRKFKFPDDVENLLSVLSSFFGDLLLPVVRNSRIRFKYFRLTVASPDPADTAIRYGIISQSVAYFLHILATNARVSKRQLAKVSLDCSFTEEKTTLALYMTVTLSVWKLLFLLATGAVKFFGKLGKFKSKNISDKNKDKKIEGHKVK